MKKAFTLIELLVVIAIIGLLATLAVISLNNARSKTRDAKRVADLKQISTALELYFNDIGRYPTIAEFNYGSIYSTSTTDTTTYMAIIPSAPNPPDGSCSASDNAFLYSSASDGSTYTIRYCLGGTIGSLSSGKNCLTESGPNLSACFFCGDQITITAIASHACNTGAPDYDTCTYNTIAIGNQCWMQESINIGVFMNHLTFQTDNNVIEKYCYNDDTNICLTDGGLYQWNEAMQYAVSSGAQGICPDGWHIPSDTEQYILENYLTDTGQTCDPNRIGSGCNNAGNKLYSNGISGFKAKKSGYLNTHSAFLSRNAGGYIWSSSFFGGADVWYRVMGSTGVPRYKITKNQGFSIRCLQN